MPELSDHALELLFYGLRVASVVQRDNKIDIAFPQSDVWNAKVCAFIHDSYVEDWTHFDTAKALVVYLSNMDAPLG